MLRYTIRLVLAPVLAFAFVLAVALAPNAGAASGARPVRDCTSLARVFTIPGATTHVEVAKEVKVDGQPGHCYVEGFVEPAVRFQLKLPIDDYSGRYVQYGCHGLCGSIVPPSFPSCGGPHGGDMAVAATDDGHVGEGEFFTAIVDGRGLAGDRAARDDYFFRAPHALSRAAKHIIKAYYGAPPAHSYFNGCSTGGREGLLLAQRYPDDFDGIIAGSSAHAMGPLLGVYFAWLTKVNQAPNGAPILTTDKLPALTGAVMGACDKLDGLVDQQIDDPRACRFDPVAIKCPPGADRPDCLTAAQVTVTRKLYAGPRDERGRRLYPGWQSYGTESAWAGAVIPTPFGSLAPLPDNYLKYVGYPLGTPHSSLAAFTFTARELHRLTPEGVKGNAMSLDLRRFRQAGGKLILWHAWADQSIPAVGTLDYYDRLARQSGGLRATQRWARTFMVPTMNHCGFGGTTVLSQFDPFPQLVDWVERGRAPERVIASGKDAQQQPRTRPIFPYPLRARYDGTGSINDARNFVPVRPPAPPHDTIRWIGEYLHHLRPPAEGI